MYAYPVSRSGGSPHRPGVQHLPSVLRSSARLPLSVMCLSRSLRRTTRATRASLFRRERIARVRIRCRHASSSFVCWTGRTRASDARFGAGRFITHACVFATCTHQFTTHLIIDKTCPTRTSDGAPCACSHKRQGRVARSAMSCSFRFAARSWRCHVILRFRTRYRAAPTRTAQGLTSGTRRAHECQMFTRGRARTRYSQRALIQVTTSVNGTKHTHHMEQRVFVRVQPRVVRPFSCRCCAFGVDSTDRCSAFG